MITVNRLALAEAAAECARIAVARSPIEQFQSVKLADGDGLQLAAISDSVSVRVGVAAEGELPPVCVHAQRFFDLVSAISADSLELSLDGPSLKIAGGRGRRTLPVTSADQFPEPQIAAEGPVTLEAERLAECLAFTAPHIVDDPAKPFANGVCFITHEDKLLSIAGDGRELAMIEVGPCERDIHITLNGKMVEAVRRMLGAGRVELSFDERRARVVTAFGMIEGPLLDTPYPAHLVIKQAATAHASSAVVEAKELLAALHEVRPVGADDRLSRSRIVKMTLNGAGTLSTQSHEGSAEREFPADYSADEFVIGFASSRMDRMLRHFGDRVLTLGFDGPNDRIRIEANGLTDRVGLLFPLRI